jgi:MoaA/NifB/PqqE/SkfB family radical SAM enzyme
MPPAPAQFDRETDGSPAGQASPPSGRPRFPKIYLEITSACNLACPFCPPTRRPPAFMTRDFFDLILSRLGGFGDHLYFHLKGEPLLHPFLGDFLEAAAQAGFSVTLVTNGTLVADRAELLLGASNIRKLGISLHSHIGQEGLERYWSGVEAFLDAHRQRPSFPVSLRLWSRGPAGLPPETALLWNLLRSRYPDAAMLAGDLTAASAGSGSARLDQRVWLNLAERFDWPDPALPESETRGSCHGLRNQIGVLADGRVVPCCLDGEGILDLGNLADTGLAEILASPRARAIREGFLRQELVEPLCRTCGYRRRFPAAKEDKSRQVGAQAPGGRPR